MEARAVHAGAGAVNTQHQQPLELLWGKAVTGPVCPPAAGPWPPWGLEEKTLTLKWTFHPRRAGSMDGLAPGDY